MRTTVKYRREEGAAILLVLAAIVVVVILGAAIFLVARVSLERAAQNTDSGKALSVAESGLQNAADLLAESPVVPSPTPVTLPLVDMAGKGQYEVSYITPAPLPWFSIQSTGYYPNQAEALGRRRIKAEVFALSPWDFFYAGGMSGAVVEGNISVHGPFYVNDNLTLSGTAGVHDGPLILHNTSAPGNADLIVISNSVDVGDLTKGITLFMDGDIVEEADGGTMYINDIYPSAPELEFPDLTERELAYYRADNPNSPWLADVERPTAVWDSDTTTNQNTGLTFSKSSPPLPLPSDARLHGKNLLEPGGRISWAYSGSNPTYLTITFDNSGNVYPILFIDGDLYIDGGGGGLVVRYRGIGTIVTSGKISIRGNLVPASSTLTGLPASMTDFPDKNRLGLVTRSDVNLAGNTGQWVGAAIYAGGTASFTNQISLRGGLITRRMDLGEQVPDLWAQPGFSFKLPPRMPGADIRINSIIGWNELSPKP